MPKEGSREFRSPGPAADVRELIRVKTQPCRASAYPTPEYGSSASPQTRSEGSRKRGQNDNWSDLMEEITPTHKAYWAVAKALKTDVRGHACPQKPDNDLAFDDQEKAEYLADSIELQCSLNPAPPDLEHVNRVENEVLRRSSLPPKDDLPSVSADEVQKLIRELKPRKAPGLDGVNNKAIKCFSTPLVALLVAIFNACIQNCHFPEAWKEAVIIGIPKPGKPRDLPTSYRPISLLSGLGKLFEKVLKSRLSDHLLGKGLIINEQFGKRPNHSCPQQALRLVEHISEGFKRKRKTVAVFFDVAKAFDKVWHAGLIYKLHQLQVPDRLVFIIQHYLTNRHFSFRHEKSISAKRLIRAGVPQGSTLSPLLYSAYTNDIPRPQTGVQLALFADDTALYLSGSNFRIITPRLQKAIGLSPSGNGKPRTDLIPPALEGAPSRHQVSPAHPPSSLTPSSVPRLLVHLRPSSGKPAGRPASSIVRRENNRRLLDTCAAVDNCTAERARLYNTMDQHSPCPPGAGGSGPKKQITFEFIQQVLTKALSEIGYEAPQELVNKLIARASPSSSDEGTTCSDSTVVGSDSESESSSKSFTLVEGKNKRALKKALKKVKTTRDQPEMDIDPSPAPTTCAKDTQPPPSTVQTTQITTNRASTTNSGSKPNAPPKVKPPPPIYLLKGSNFVKISADCTRLRINYSKATRVAEDKIKITVPDVETFRSLNKYLIENKIQFHTYALEEERKLKVVIRGVPEDICTDDIKSDLVNQGFPVVAVYRITRRDGSSTGLILAVLPKTDEARAISRNLSKVCGLSGIRVEAPHKRGVPSQCHRCQRYGHASANCHVQPRCVKCLVPTGPANVRALKN
ncbi:Probable RNA-directed DNA polymerase from transposon BS [Eumeta japonica]|uniref:Probable RNA-directed DNA polymerase from transposon BS n=1 Tax=Eumeta variegata TaxID=151549 RepID=A0A4C1ZM25_EUMVA|nr:Probable RNA-directed DNA polymerase from transposon BS [Eumeta japonica]